MTTRWGGGEKTYRRPPEATPPNQTSQRDQNKSKTTNDERGKCAVGGRGPTPRSAPLRRANENKTHGGRGRPPRHAQRPRRRTIDPTASERMGKTNESGAHSPRRIMRQSIAGETAATSFFLGFWYNFLFFWVIDVFLFFFFFFFSLVFLLFVLILVFVSFSLSF
jgi:hypothetical protein